MADGWLVTVALFELWRMDDMSMVFYGFLIFFLDLFVWLRHVSLYCDGLTLPEQWIFDDVCPYKYKDHSASSTATSPHPTFWSRVDPSCCQDFLYSLSLACYLMCFDMVLLCSVNVCSCCFAQCCIWIICSFDLVAHHFLHDCQGWRERWRAQRIQRSKPQKGNTAETRRHDMPRCTTVIAEVLTPIRLLNYTIVGWAVVSRQHIMSNFIYIGSCGRLVE